MTYLNISHPYEDTELEATLGVMSHVVQVVRAAGDDSVARALQTAATSTSTTDVCVELVAHASDGVITLGNWRVDDQDPGTNDLYAASTAELQVVSAIRLLGCYTAATLAGQAAMQHLNHVLGVRVQGTSVALHAQDFDANGLVSTNLLYDTDSLPSVTSIEDLAAVSFDWFQKLPWLVTDELFDRLRAETNEQARHDVESTYPTCQWPFQEVDEATFTQYLKTAALHPEVAVARGLLASPELELVVAVHHGLYRRMTLLLGGYLVRVYPDGEPEGVVILARHSLIGGRREISRGPRSGLRGTGTARVGNAGSRLR